MQGRKKVMTMLKQQLVERRRNAAERETTEDFFDLVIDELNKPDPMMDESTALDLLFTMLFASHETTSMVLTVILKYLTDNPKALQELTVSRLIHSVNSFLASFSEKIRISLYVFRRSTKESWKVGPIQALTSRGRSTGL